MEAEVSRDHRKPWTVNTVCTDPRHAGDRGTAATFRMAAGTLVPLNGVRVFPYESGDDTWDFTCPRCGRDVRIRHYALLAEVEALFIQYPGSTRVDLDITTLYGRNRPAGPLAA